MSSCSENEETLTWPVVLWQYVMVDDKRAGELCVLYVCVIPYH